MKETMDMYSQQIERYSIEEYGYDIWYAGWNPEVASVRQQDIQPATNKEQGGISAEISTDSVDSFLGRIYSSQC